METSEAYICIISSLERENETIDDPHDYDSETAISSSLMQLFSAYLRIIVIESLPLME